jgi:hypothetical protein
MSRNRSSSRSSWSLAVPQVVFTGWKPPFDKVLLYRLLRARAGLGLAAAKEAVDRLLDGEGVCIEISDCVTAEDLLAESRSVGATCHIADTTDLQSARR